VKATVKDGGGLFLLDVVVAVANIGKGEPFGHQPFTDIDTTGIAACDSPAIFVQFQRNACCLRTVELVAHSARYPTAARPIRPLFGHTMLIGFWGVDGMQADADAGHLESVTVDHSNGTCDRISKKRACEANKKDK